MPQQDCPNVFVYRTQPEGFGHRITGLVMAVALALRANAAVAIDSSSLLHGGDGVSWIADFFGLDAFLMLPGPDASAWLAPGSHDTPWGRLTFQPSDDAVASSERAQQSCGGIYSMATGGDRACKPEGYCYFSSRLGAVFTEASPVFRRLYVDHGALMPLTLFQRSCHEGKPSFVVAWHVRNGDINLLVSPTFYASVLDMVTAALESAQLPAAEHHLFSQFRVSGSHAFLTGKEFAGFTKHAGSDPKEALAHIAGADVVVHTGSSYSLVASLVAPFSQVKLMGPTKEFVSLGPKSGPEKFVLPGTIEVASNGSVSSESRALLLHLVQARASDIGTRCHR
jgi:hypothetical protein